MFLGRGYLTTTAHKEPTTMLMKAPSIGVRSVGGRHMEEGYKDCTTDGDEDRRTGR